MDERGRRAVLMELGAVRAMVDHLDRHIHKFNSDQTKDMQTLSQRNAESEKAIRQLLTAIHDRLDALGAAIAEAN